MILKCSAGHSFIIPRRDTLARKLILLPKFLSPGDRCPTEISYDRMNNPASTKCGRTLHRVKSRDEVVKKWQRRKK